MYKEILLNVHAKGLELNERINTIKEHNTAIVLKSEKLLESLEELHDAIKKKQPHLCAVCLENDVTHSFVPCGHCFCQTCGNQAHRRNRCPNCRNSIASLHRVWL